ncbi:hypothetical protein [Propionibacterium freudenreichii]|uniref:hypothetical protein n=1 Tax=Propionibacterium freudenreichii TaxID=1744 RepID=UPI0018C1D572|nr:hypothetical protein [Propionibacterium freudenreichii]
MMGEQPMRLPREQRRELVTYLAGEGMSTRAIAPIVGAGQRTVVRDVQAGEPFDSPTYAEASTRDPEPDAEPTVQVAARSVIGLDGHTYPGVDRQTGEITHTAPSVPRRKPWRDLADVASRSGSATSSGSSGLI